MHPEILSKLHCHGCGERLAPIRTVVWDGDEIVTGAVRCPRGHLYLITGSILDLLPDGPGPRSPAQWSNFSRLSAAVYEPLWRARSLSLLAGEPFGFDRELSLLLDFVGAPRPGLWLDLAASTALYGRTLAGHLAALGGVVIATDFSMPMLCEARRRARAEDHRNLGFVRCRAERLPFAGGQLAGALCGGSLNEFGPRAIPRILRELRRCLAPGAAVVCMHLGAGSHPAARALQRVFALGGVVFPQVEASNRLFAEAGFTAERQERYGVVVFTRLRVAR